MKRLYILFALGLLSCRRAHYTTIDPSGLPEFLRPLPGAAKVLATRQDDSSTSIRYGLEEPYPADETLRTLRQRLEKAGWHPLQNDFLNPSLPSSHVRGWTDFGDATISPPAHVHQWLAQWRNPAGDVVMYSLRYVSPSRSGAYPLIKPDDSHLQVYGMLMPAPLASAMLSAVTTPSPPSR